MGRKKGKKNGRRNGSPAKKKTTPFQHSPAETTPARRSGWKIVGGLAALVTAISIGYYASRAEESVIVPVPTKTNQKKVEYSPKNQNKITFVEAKQHEHLQEQYLDQLYERRGEISGAWVNMGGLVSSPIKDDPTFYGAASGEKKGMTPLMVTRVEKKDVRPIVHVSPKAFDFCMSRDEFYSLIDNEAITCAEHMGEMNITSNVKAHLTYEGLEPITKKVIHEMISSQYQIQLIRKGQRKVSPHFREKSEETYTFLCYRLKQIWDQNLQARPIISGWLDIQNPKPNEDLAKLLGITVQHAP